mmetsp:Transcript_5911/g.13754  ORF Transcript_5911/g.13754 Transcript_5911/m.13754 type:complete len:274 (-) Transcript_5911:278-1099(-)|eukprot:CAMPEP_0206455524 /NCGR_PEP_ID=MMETSP0324_2-20121206/21806_1 /ASSEMBLY_ACC=CAM_ASM_000836 /TAXON_ID=2866 /ORGANISM="Crypthecodinium cohnii, Strain Seligo" /LENGTH=273 /DNA_ID=CAMNT_0053926249 /DNA_START=73 /DNA_END=894 /DNA_ORIENTATION=-
MCCRSDTDNNDHSGSTSGGAPQWQALPADLVNHFVDMMIQRQNLYLATQQGVPWKSGKYIGTNLTGPLLHFDLMRTHARLLTRLSPFHGEDGGSLNRHLSLACSTIPESGRAAARRFLTSAGASAAFGTTAASEVQMLLAILTDETWQDFLMTRPGITGQQILQLRNYFADNPFQARIRSATPAADSPHLASHRFHEFELGRFGVATPGQTYDIRVGVFQLDLNGELTAVDPNGGDSDDSNLDDGNTDNEEDEDGNGRPDIDDMPMVDLLLML